MNENETIPPRGRENEDILAQPGMSKPAPSGQAMAGSGGQPEPSFGERLRASRERHGISLHDCANALRLPARLLQKLEADDYEGIDYSVYLCGYLRKYADLVRLDPRYVDAQLESLQTRQPELVVTHTMPAWKHGLQRYSSAVTYIVLTAVIVVPLIWLGLNGVLKRDIARLQPLNATPVGAPSGTSDSARSPDGAVAGMSGADQAAHPGAGDIVRTPVPDQKPLMASIAPFSALRAPEQPEVVPPPVVPEATSGHTRLTVDLQQPSWVEITDDSGKRLEYALLPAGTQRAYRSDQNLNVRIGNAEGAKVEVDGKPVVLDRFRHANVAHFDVGDDGTVHPDNS